MISNRFIQSSNKFIIKPVNHSSLKQQQQSKYFSSNLIRKNTINPTSPLSSPPPPPSTPPKRPRFYSRHPIIFSILAFPFILGGSLGTVVAGLLAYDATTYSDRELEKVNLDPLALNPTRGGKKNLKIAEVLVDDSDSKSFTTSKVKQRLVIVGGGWGAVGVLKHLDPEEYHVTLVSPDNYFLFHPLLPSVSFLSLPFSPLFF